MPVTHLAGPLVWFRKLDRAIQRCAVCGEKLEDLRPSCVMVMSTDGREQIPEFAEAHLYRVFTEDASVCFFHLGEFTQTELPEDFCLALVER